PATPAATSADAANASSIDETCPTPPPVCASSPPLTVSDAETPRLPPPHRPVTWYVPGETLELRFTVVVKWPLASALAVTAPSPANSPSPTKAFEIRVTWPGT